MRRLRRLAPPAAAKASNVEESEIEEERERLKRELEAIGNRPPSFPSYEPPSPREARTKRGCARGGLMEGAVCGVPAAAALLPRRWLAENSERRQRTNALKTASNWKQCASQRASQPASPAIEMAKGNQRVTRATEILSTQLTHTLSVTHVHYKSVLQYTPREYNFWKVLFLISKLVLKDKYFLLVLESGKYAAWRL